MGRWTARREAFGKIMAGTACVYPGSVFDPMSARIAQHVGYELGMFAGSTASLTVLGAPDYIVLTLTEFAEQCHRINRAFEMPLMVDADHGYGNALNVMRTVEELEAVGVSGMSIEDTELPEPFGTNGKQRMLSLEEGVGKMKAAVAARGNTGIRIAGRTSAPALADMDETIRRAKAYEATGVDAIFLVGIKTREQLDAVSAVVSKPLVLGTATPELMDLGYLGAKGVRICLQGHHPIRAAQQAIFATMQAMREGAMPGKLSGMPSDELMNIATRQDAYDKARKDYL